MKIRSALFTGLVLSALTCGSAFADTLFNFSFSGSTFSGSGQFDTQATATAGEYLITGVTGTTNGKMIAGIETVGSNPNFNNDNLLFYNSAANANYFDQFGVLYALSTGADVNLFHKSGVDQEYLLRANMNNFLLESATITLAPNSSPVPEPESLVLLGTGLLGAMGMLRRRIVSVSRS